MSGNCALSNGHVRARELVRAKRLRLNEMWRYVLTHFCRTKTAFPVPKFIVKVFCLTYLQLLHHFILYTSKMNYFLSNVAFDEEKNPQDSFESLINTRIIFSSTKAGPVLKRKSICK
jgi:hypothetical protein